MANDIRLLEDLVNKAVVRLKQLSAERERLREEVDSLRVRLDALDAEAATGAREAGNEEAAWQTQREHVLSGLRETLQELRGDLAPDAGRSD